MATRWAAIEPSVGFRNIAGTDGDPEAAKTSPKTGTLHGWRRLWRRCCAGAEAVRACIFSLQRWARVWAGVLDLAYVAWVVRVPLIALLAGLLLMGFAPQAQDLLVDLADDTTRVEMFLLLVMIWVAVTTYASYLLLGTDRRLLDRAIATKNSDAKAYQRSEVIRTAMPYVLGALPFVIVFIASKRSEVNLPDITDAGKIAAVKLSLSWFSYYLYLLFAFFTLMSLWRPKAICALLNKGEAAPKGLDERMPARLKFGVSAAGADPPRPTEHHVGPLLLMIVFLASAAIFICGPNQVAEWLPRALIVPVVLGGWLPLLTCLSALGRRLRAPLISGGFLLLALVSAVFGDNHSVRRIVTAQAAPPSDAGAYSPMTLNDAVLLWMKENGCESDRDQCPRPIIVAGAGGASRAGFFTASVIGNLMDGAGHYVATAMPALDPTAVRKRIFAISGVSGGSVGAVMTVAAMARGGVDTKQPCTKPKPTLWYSDEINNWRDCLEALTAGDFLTPVVLGLIFNDSLSFGVWPDRAEVLERSWEDRFADLTQASADPDWRNKCPGDLRCAFMTLRPKPGQWLPLLVINGTSSATGRRIITSVLAPDYTADDCPTLAPSQFAAETKRLEAARKRALIKDRPAAQQAVGTDLNEDACLLFLESNSFHELLDSRREPDRWTRFMVWLRGLRPSQVMNDVTLSTAAHNSARFPLISPPGAVRNRNHQVIDRIVDGGYVDNYGALTALELAQAIHAIEPKLAPFVLSVSNDPDEDPDLNPLDVPDGAFLSDIMVPFDAIMSARSGHGRLAMGQVEAVLDHLAGSACGAQTARVRVWPQFISTAREGNSVLHDDTGSEDKTISEKKISRPVSMSWWLSTPIQIHLHQQTEETRSNNKNQADMGKIWTALDKPAGCIGQQVMPSAAAEAKRAKRPATAPPD